MTKQEDGSNKRQCCSRYYRVEAAGKRNLQAIVTMLLPHSCLSKMFLVHGERANSVKP
jgi:hypothetical protein